MRAISLFVNFYGHVRADAPAEGAGSALASIRKEDEMVALTTFLINRYLSHAILSHRRNELDADCR
jgi:hypothetical protein